MRLEPVNCYIGECADGSLILIDTGFAMNAEIEWLNALASIGYSLDDVGKILVTHFHPDHIGALGVLSRASGAELLASPMTVEQTPGVWGPSMAKYHARIMDQCRDHGLPGQVIAALDHEPAMAGIGVDVPETISVIDDLEVIAFAGINWKIILTPGHADGHLSLFDEHSGSLISGDHLLERITPAVGVFPDHSTNPLSLYLESLRRIQTLEVDSVLPGHGAEFTGSSTRCTQIITHHEERLEACLNAIRGVNQRSGSGNPDTWSIAVQLFGTRHDAANKRFALAETHAHLALLEVRGEVDRIDDTGNNGLVCWHIA